MVAVIGIGWVGAGAETPRSRGPGGMFVRSPLCWAGPTFMLLYDIGHGDMGPPKHQPGRCFTRRRTRFVHFGPGP
jgi:hypothetical protein